MSYYSNWLEHLRGDIEVPFERMPMSYRMNNSLYETRSLRQRREDRGGDDRPQRGSERANQVLNQQVMMQIANEEAGRRNLLTSPDEPTPSELPVEVRPGGTDRRGNLTPERLLELLLDNGKTTIQQGCNEIFNYHYFMDDKLDVACATCEDWFEAKGIDWLTTTLMNDWGLIGVHKIVDEANPGDIVPLFTLKWKARVVP